MVKYQVDEYVSHLVCFWDLQAKNKHSVSQKRNQRRSDVLTLLTCFFFSSFRYTWRDHVPVRQEAEPEGADSSMGGLVLIGPYVVL